MEHGVGIVPGDQRGLARGGLGIVRDVEHHRLGPGQAVLVDEVRHPRPARLVVALPGIEIEQRQFAAILVIDGVNRHVRVIDRNVGALLEGQPVELVGGIEHAVFQHVGDLEIGLHLVLVERVALLAQLFGIVIPVRRGDGELAAFLADEGVEIVGIALLRRAQRRGEAFEEADRRRRGLGHLVGQGIGGIAVEPEQLGLLGPQRRDLDDQAAGIVGIATLAAVPAAFEQRLAGRPVGQRGQQRLLGGVLQRQHVAALGEAPVGGVLFRRGKIARAQPGEAGLAVDDQRAILGALGQALAEFGLQRGKLAVDLGQLGLLRIGQHRAVADHVVIGQLDQLDLVGRQVQAVAGVVDRLHPAKQLGIERDRIPHRGQLGGNAGIDRVEVVVGVGRCQRAEHIDHPGQHRARLFQRDEGVLERRRVGIVGDRIDFGQLDRDALLDRRLVIAFLDLREVRRLERQVRRFGEDPGALGDHRGIGRRNRGGGRCRSSGGFGAGSGAAGQHQGGKRNERKRAHCKSLQRQWGQRCRCPLSLG